MIYGFLILILVISVLIFFDGILPAVKKRSRAGIVAAIAIMLIVDILLLVCGFMGDYIIEYLTK